MKNCTLGLLFFQIHITLLILYSIIVNRRNFIKTGGAAAAGTMV